MFKNHPKGLLAAAISNMGERFGYYIMNAVLVLFLCSKFGISEEKSTLIYSFFYAGIYLLSLVGGLIADRKQNYKGTIMAGLVVMAIGYIALSTWTKQTKRYMQELYKLSQAIPGAMLLRGYTKLVTQDDIDQLK